MTGATTFRSGRVLFCVTAAQWAMIRRLAAGQPLQGARGEDMTLASLTDRGLLEPAPPDVVPHLSDLGWRLHGVLGAILDPEGTSEALRPGSAVVGRLVSPLGPS